MGRDRRTQALLPLRGKILNVLGAASSKLGSNAEINDLCQALGVGMGTKFRVDDLRYDKIIIMTDADVDGAHIAALLMTFFFTQMRPLIDQGDPDLACRSTGSTQGAKRVYVADDAEKEVLMEKGLGGKGKIDVQRFKGLGEMDAKDLKETTMDPASRKLIRVTIDEDEPGETGDLVEPDWEKAGVAVPVYPGKRAVCGGTGCLRVRRVSELGQGAKALGLFEERELGGLGEVGDTVERAEQPQEAGSCGSRKSRRMLGLLRSWMFSLGRMEGLHA